jgi:hypothetical protein
MNMEGTPIVVVSGLPRSGTSMMMQALAAGGMPVLTDHERAADTDNPRGYLEFEPAKKLAHDTSWLPHAQGRVVKLISALLRHLPPGYRYKIIFMRREMAEVLASQRQMLRRRGATADGNDATMARAFEKHLADVAAWTETQADMEVLYVNYHDVVSDPVTQLERIKRFVRYDLTLDAMVAAIDRQLHRQRSGQ